MHISSFGSSYHKSYIQLIKNNFQSVSYSEIADIFVVEKVGKYGFYSLDGDEILKPTYPNYVVSKEYITVEENDKTVMYDFFGNVVKTNNYASVSEVEGTSYFIAKSEDGYYSIISKDVNVNDKYIYMEYAFGDYFIFTNEENKTGVLHVWEGVVIEPAYTVILKIEGMDALEARDEANALHLYNSKLEEVFAFCPECGASLAGVFPVAESSESQGTTIERSAANSNDTVGDTSAPPVQARGFILTNITALASRLRTNTTTIATLLTWYVENMRQMGVAYKVLDAGDYTYQKKPLFGNPKHVSLTPNDPWYAYADILKDQHDYEVKEHLPETDYLFIVGGDNVVPMPCMPNYITKFDKYFDTDLLYAYPYGADMERKLLSQEIFKYDALFYIGRLPIAEDGNLGDLQGYFERVIANGCAVEVKEAYAQCDPHWRNVTMMLTDELAQYDLFPRYVDEIPTDILYQGRLFTTRNRNSHQKLVKRLFKHANNILLRLIREPIISSLICMVVAKRR